MFTDDRKFVNSRIVLILIIFASAYTIIPAQASLQAELLPNLIEFAVIGDYGQASQAELDVSNLVKSWNPDFVITTGDNNYPDGAAQTIDQNIGQYYHEFIYPYTGTYGTGAEVNRFLPSLGGHDWYTLNAQPYLDYFTLPGNERYYDYVWGPVHFFVINTADGEPDGISSSSVQAAWLQSSLAASTSAWNLVYMHDSPFSSGSIHGSTSVMQWPYAAWGADAVLSGHDHTYERIFQNGIPYFVNGLGGRSIYSFGTPISGSQVRYNGDYGAMLVEADEWQITFQFVTRTGITIDTYTLNQLDTPTPTDTSTPTATSTWTATATFTPTPPGTSTPTYTPTATPTSTFTATITPGAGIYDDLDAGWTYTGSWATYSGSGPYNSSLRYTSTVGATASFTFSGTQFIFSYTQNPYRGSFEVFVDGNKLSTINANGALQWQKTFTSPLLSAGTHTVQIRHAGGGTHIDVDAITIN